MGWLKDSPIVMKWVVLSLFMGAVLSQNDCKDLTKCNECIQTPNCQWCSKFKESVPERTTHCLSITADVSSICEISNIENPQNSQAVLQNEPLSSRDDGRERDEMIVQIAPQRTRLNLRRGIADRVTLTYRQAQAYPIDLYYLMDLSKSMSDDKDQLVSLSGRLSYILRNLTENYHIGFGSFVDKVMLPFVDTNPNKINKPCRGCARPFSFRNDLKLGPDGVLFSERVSDANISGNLDNPEGGLDALMQVIVCKEEIQWRDQARRIVLFSTDSQFHQAGDGRLAGVVVPNDEKCHLNAVGEYDAYDEFDYPSIGQINKMSKEKGIHIIFAVSSFFDTYKNLSEIIENSSFGKIDINSANIVELVRDQYNKITSVISLTDNASDAVSIQYSSKCKNESGLPIITKECFGMREGDEVIFNLDVKLNYCPAERDREIIEVKTLQDSLFLEIEFQCTCNCDKMDDHEEANVLCNDHGALICGVCSCFEGFHGENCLCSADSAGVDREDQEKRCKANLEDEDVCSGKGLCVCDVCECTEKGFSGKYCQCNDRKCMSPKGEVCSGQGICNCGMCLCNIGYVGELCECNSEDACRKPGDTDICSGHGWCECGKCLCSSTEEVIYSGRYCEDCLTCRTGRCSEFLPGILCRFNDPTSSSCNLTTIAVDSVEAEEERGAGLCSFVDEEDGCLIVFTYRYEETGTYIIHIEKDKKCPEPASTMDCPIPYLEIGQHCIFVNNDQVGDWSAAKYMCERIEGTLITLDDANLMADVVDYIHEQKITDAFYWIGGSDAAKEGNWVWTDGSPMRLGTPFWNYHDGIQAPNGGTSQNCAYLHKDHFFFIDDWNCEDIGDYHFGAVCELSPFTRE